MFNTLLHEWYQAAALRTRFRFHLTSSNCFSTFHRRIQSFDRPLPLMSTTLSSSYRDFAAYVRRHPTRRQQRKTIATGTHPFFKLPPELRHYINSPVMFSKDDNKHRIHTVRLSLLTCTRRFYEDAAPMVLLPKCFQARMVYRQAITSRSLETISRKVRPRFKNHNLS